jgi:hypothetical protein
MPGPAFGKAWNTENCYAYAINRDGFRKDPGDGNFFENGVINPIKLREALSSDGATLVTRALVTPDAGSMPGKYLIAVKCDANGINYHVLRRDESSGLWFSKVPLSEPGVYMQPPFEPISNDWNPNPLLSERGNLMVWIGYYWVPDVGLDR